MERNALPSFHLRSWHCHLCPVWLLRDLTADLFASIARPGSCPCMPLLQVNSTVGFEILSIPSQKQVTYGHIPIIPVYSQCLECLSGIITSSSPCLATFMDAKLRPPTFRQSKRRRTSSGCWSFSWFSLLHGNAQEGSNGSKKNNLCIAMPVPLLQCPCLVSLSGGLACQSCQSKQHFEFFHLSTKTQRMVVYRISKVAGFGSKALIMLPVIYLLALHLLPPEFRLEGVRLNEERRMESKNIRKSEIELWSLGVASGEVLGYRIDRVSNGVNSSVDMVDAWGCQSLRA